MTANEIRKAIEQKEAELKSLRSMLQDAERVDYRRQRASYDERKQRKAKELPAVAQWAAENLKPGMRLKMSGTRDGRGVREFMSLRDMSVEGRQVFIRWRGQWVDGKFVQGPSTETLGQITQHHLSKLTHVQVDGQWVRINDLVFGQQQ